MISIQSPLNAAIQTVTRLYKPFCHFKRLYLGHSSLPFRFDDDLGRTI